MSKAKRDAYQARLTAFPRMPDHDLQELQRIVGAYGLPIAQLDSDTAAFVLRRVMHEYFKLSILKRASKPGMFTPDELLELMHRRGWTPIELASITRADDPRAGLSNISRWLNKASMPQGIHAMRVNRLIEQYVRKPDQRRTGGNLGQRRKNPTENPDSIRRREYDRARRKIDNVPTASAAREEQEGTDA
jgi:hypothetical protein